MDLKVIISIGLVSILGFLFYPRDSGPKAPMVGYESEWISTQETVKDEPLHGAKLRKTNPVVGTYDLRYIYKVNKAEIAFSQNPKNYDVLSSTVKDAQKYARLTSKDEHYPVINLLHKEARWIQVVVNDWPRTRPDIKSVRISARYSRHSPVKNIRTRYNPNEAYRLIDGLKKGNAAKWLGGKRVGKEVEKDGKKVKEITYESPGRGGVDVTFDLGISKRIYGIAVTTGGEENNLKQYEIATSVDRRSFQNIYTSGELENKTVTDLHMFTNKVQARYVQLRVPSGEWYGNYPEIREVEIYVDEYRPSNYDAQIQEYNATQVYYDNCGMAGNAQAPNVIQGFPFDRGGDAGQENKYFLKPGEEADAKNSPSERSFCYHYDKIVLRYPYLEPKDIYWVQVTYLQEKDGKRIQSLDVDGFLLHDDMAIPANEAAKFTYAIPPAAYADGEIELHFNRLSGPNAVVSEVSLLRASKGGAVAMRPDGGTTALASAPRVSDPVVIDGLLNEWPDIYPLPPGQYRGDPLYSPSQMYVQWDRDNLYIALKVNRSKLNTGADASTLMQSFDTLHVFVDTNLERSPGMYKTGDHHFRFSRLGVPASERRVLASQIHHHLDAIPRTIENNKNIEVAATLASGNSEYTLEARIPKDNGLYEFSPQSGGMIGFNYILSNSRLDGKGKRSKPGVLRYPLFWSATEVSAPPALWGRLELVGTVSGQPAIMDQSLTKKLKTFRAGERLVLVVRDPDRNTDRTSPQSIKVRISGNHTKDSKEIVLHETTQALFTQASESGPQTANNSDLFAGELLTEFSATPSENPSALAIQGNEIVTLEYLDPYYGRGQRDVGVSYAATVEVGVTGAVQIVSEAGVEINSFNAGDRLVFKVEDKDEMKPEKQQPAEGDEAAQAEPPASVSINVVCAEDSETVILVDAENSGIFIGSIETVYSREDAADGILQVEGYDIVKAIYRDAIQTTGNTNVPMEAEAIVNIGGTGLLSLGMSNNGKLEDFVNIENFNAGHDLIVRLRDPDIDIDKTAVEQVNIEVTGDIVQDAVTLVLTETELSSGIFFGVLQTAYGLEADKSNNMLEVRGNEVATFIYNDALQATGATSARVSKTAVVNVGNDGVVSILKSTYLELEEFNAGDRIYFKVDDADLNLDSGQRDEVEISVSSEKTLDGETVTLRERNPRSGVFFGSLGTEYVGQAGGSSSAPAPDNILQVQGNETVTATYLDTLLASGETNVSATDTCKVSVGATGKITIYNKLNPYTPIAGFPDEGWEGEFKAGDTLLIRLEDADLSLSDAVAEIFHVRTTDDLMSDSESIVLTEATGSAGVFVGEVKTEYGVEAIPGDDVLQVQGEGRININYRDAITGTGETAILIPVTLIVKTGEMGTLQAISAAGHGVISSFSSGDDFIVRVRDGDLNMDPKSIDQATIIIRGTLLEDELELVLQETELSSGVFTGRVQSVYASQADFYDSLLQVQEKEIFTLRYIDEVGVTGETNLPVSVELVVRSGSAGSLIITDENGRELANLNAGRKLYFRLDDFVLSNMFPNTPARIIVRGNKTGDSEEVLLNERPGEQGIYTGSISTNYGTTPIQDGTLQVRGGEEVNATYIPRAPGVPSDPIVDITYTNEGSAGKLTIAGENGLKLTNFNAGDTLYLKLEDFDLNLNTFAIDTVDVWVVGDAIARGKTITLNETGEDTGIFEGSVDTRYGRGVFEGRSILEVVGGEQITAVYYDALDNLGETDMRVVDSCRANMLGTASFAPRGVTIDGNLGEWPLENALRAGDERSNVYIQWDRDNLYILAYIMDSDVVVPDATQFWDGADALEIHIDTAPTSDVSPYLRDLKKASSYLFWICPKGAGPDGSMPYVGQNLPETIYNYTAIQVAAKISPGSRYILEARIPFDPVLGGFDPYKTAKGERVGFNYIIHRSNAPQLRWAAGPESEPDLLPSFFGTLIFKQPSNTNE